jgi:hypothetical protein
MQEVEAKERFDKFGELVETADKTSATAAKFQLPAESATGYKTPNTLFHPSHPLKVRFDIFVGVLIVYSVIAVPFRLGFSVEDGFGLTLSDAIIDSFFWRRYNCHFSNCVLERRAG